MTTRRKFISGVGTGAMLAATKTLVPIPVFASAHTQKRLVVVLLRGGMDGMAALAPYGDPNYEQLRGELALNPDALLRIDSFFALHPVLDDLAKMYRDGDMIAVPAAATPYRKRSHFDAQDVLELGSVQPKALESGWLNRVVGLVNAQDSGIGMALGQGLPTLMRGPNDVSSWAPSTLPDANDDYLSLVAKIYEQDQLFADYFSKALDIQNMAMDVLKGNEQQLARKSRSLKAFITMAKAAGKWLAKLDGPRVSSMEMGGWDTHVQQGTEGGRMANNLALFARGIKALKDSLGPAAWSNTVVLAVTEFGRTARPNGNRGTDHGTAGTAFLFGGALQGGRIVHRWPGLKDADLYQGRDLQPTIDIRSVIKGVLHEHYAISKSALDEHVFPNSSEVEPIKGLIRT